MSPCRLVCEQATATGESSFAVDDVQQEYERLRGLGVRFTQDPTTMGLAFAAVVNDTCGNLIQIAQETPTG